jgi:hypothetical protein
MTAKSFAMVAAIIFAVGAVVQFLRVALGWTIVVNGTPLPYWPSLVAFVVLAALSLLGFRAAARG